METALKEDLAEAAEQRPVQGCARAVSLQAWYCGPGAQGGEKGIWRRAGMVCRRGEEGRARGTDATSRTEAPPRSASRVSAMAGAVRLVLVSQSLR